MNVGQAKRIDSQEFYEYLGNKSSLNNIELCDLIVVYDGKEVKLSKEKTEFYSMTGLNNIRIVEDILEKLSEMGDCPSEFIKIVNDNFWELV